MAKEAPAAAGGSLLKELFSPQLYKRSQGRITRQATAIALVVGIALGCWRLTAFLVGEGAWVTYGIPAAVLGVGSWLAYRLVNLPKFADFLIAVEAEMAKVTWPTKLELYRATVVVLITMFGLAFLLLFADSLWKWMLTQMGVLG